MNVVFRFLLVQVWLSAKVKIKINVLIFLEKTHIQVASDHMEYSEYWMFSAGKKKNRDLCLQKAIDRGK